MVAFLSIYAAVGIISDRRMNRKEKGVKTILSLAEVEALLPPTPLP